jgi:hypothetical protein
MNTACSNCKKEVTLSLMFECKVCNREEDVKEDNKTKEPPLLFCKQCTSKCYGCDERGCENCVEIVCCDCSVSMCEECRNNETQCGCYGKCFWCGRDVNRGSDGWPCYECDRWGCWDCRRYNNGCKECNPNYESEEEEEEEELKEELNEELNEELKEEVKEVLKEEVKEEVIEAPNEEAPNEEAPNEEAPNEEAPNEEAPNEEVIEAPNEEAPNNDIHVELLEENTN